MHANEDGTTLPASAHRAPVCLKLVMLPTAPYGFVGLGSLDDDAAITRCGAATPDVRATIEGGVSADLMATATGGMVLTEAGAAVASGLAGVALLRLNGPGLPPLYVARVPCLSNAGLIDERRSERGFINPASFTTVVLTPAVHDVPYDLFRIEGVEFLFIAKGEFAQRLRGIEVGVGVETIGSTGDLVC
jgi:hypothetical protein